MTTENMTSKPRGKLNKVLKTLLFGSLCAMAGLVIAHFAWTYSGSNKWELEIDKNGNKVYSIKSPGSSLKHFKGTTRIKSTLNRVVAAMMAHDAKHCAQWFPTCSSAKTLEPWDSKSLSGVSDLTFYRIDYPSPFAPREFLLESRASQDPENGSVLITFTAAPDKLPRNDCCFRMAYMSNSWQFTPVGNGEIEVEFQENMDQGLPYVMVNRLLVDGIYQSLNGLQKYVDQQEWQTAKFDFLKERS